MARGIDKIFSLFSNTRVRTAGYVVCRQKPATAKGNVFLTLEDEIGLLNVVVKPNVYNKYRQVARMEPLLVIEGILQKKGGTINIVAEYLIPCVTRQCVEKMWRRVTGEKLPVTD